jgi:hypothetical protein
VGGLLFTLMGFAGLFEFLREVGDGGEHALHDFQLLVLRNERIFLVKASVLNGLERGKALVEGAVIGGLVAEQDGESGGEFAGGGSAEKVCCADLDDPIKVHDFFRFPLWVAASRCHTIRPRSCKS